MPILRVTAAMTVAAAVAFAQPAAQPATARPDADLLLVNGRIYTLDPANAWAEAIAISGSRIAAVGTTDAIRRLAAPGARVIDLRGAFALPGFNDAHVHVDSTGSLLVGASGGSYTRRSCTRTISRGSGGCGSSPRSTRITSPTT